MLKKILNKFLQPTTNRCENKLTALWRQARKYRLPEGNTARLKILYGPAFSIYRPAYVHDSLLSLALYLRGMEIIPIYWSLEKIF